MDARQRLFGKAAQRPEWATSDSPYAFNRDGLEEELNDYALHLRLTDKDCNERHEFHERIVSLIREVADDAAIILFGSFACGLSIPSSDIDIAVCFEGGMAEGLARVMDIADAIGDSGLVVEVVGNHVPLVKVHDLATDLQCDITVTLDAAQAQDHVDTQMQQLEDYPMARPLVMVMKALFRQWDMNSSFHGGISSTAVFLLVIRFFCERGVPPASQSLDAAVLGVDTGLASLFLDFLGYLGQDCFANGFGVVNNEGADITRKAYRTPELQVLARHTLDQLQQLVSSGSNSMMNSWNRPLSILSAVLVSPRSMGSPTGSQVSGMNTSNNSASGRKAQQHSSNGSSPSKPQNKNNGNRGYRKSGGNNYQQPPSRKHFDADVSLGAPPNLPNLPSYTQTAGEFHMGGKQASSWRGGGSFIAAANDDNTRSMMHGRSRNRHGASVFV